MPRAAACQQVPRTTRRDSAGVGARNAGVDVRTATPVSQVSQREGRAVGAVPADGTRLGVTPALTGAVRWSRATSPLPDRERHAGRRALYYRYVRTSPSPAVGRPMVRSSPSSATSWPTSSPATLADASRSVSTSVSTGGSATTRSPASMRLLRRHRGLWDRYAASQSGWSAARLRARAGLRSSMRRSRMGPRRGREAAPGPLDGCRHGLPRQHPLPCWSTPGYGLPTVGPLDREV